jgi:hypothetical protein
MKGLIHSDPSQRTTVSQARLHPWINTMLHDYQPIDHSVISYLHTFAKHDEQQESQSCEARVTFEIR